MSPHISSIKIQNFHWSPIYFTSFRLNYEKKTHHIVMCLCVAFVCVFSPILVKFGSTHVFCFIWDLIINTHVRQLLVSAFLLCDTKNNNKRTFKYNKRFKRRKKKCILKWSSSSSTHCQSQNTSKHSQQSTLFIWLQSFIMTSFILLRFYDYCHIH